jgi:hypothetical protein
MIAAPVTRSAPSRSPFTKPAMPANTGSARRISAARAGGMRRWPHSCSGSAIAEHAIPVNTTANTASAVRVPTPCPAAAGTDRTATMPSWSAVKAAGGTFRTYAPRYTMWPANSTAHARVSSSPRPRWMSAPVSR